MGEFWPLILIAVVVVVLVGWKLAAQGGRVRATKAAAERAGFAPCPDEKAFLEERVAALENNRAYRYDVRNPRRTPTQPPVYFYEKQRQRGHSDTDLTLEREILFELRRPARSPIVVVVKPSSLSTGLGTKLIGAIAAGSWDSQPDDLARIELPRDLEGSNIIAALGTPGASFYDLIDAGTLSALQGAGDAGGLVVRMRNGWCSISSASEQIPFKVDQLVALVRPLV